MKKSLYILLLVTSMCIVGCKREKNNEPIIATGYIQCINNSSDTYKVTLDGPTDMIFNISGKKSITQEVTIGNYTITIKQLDGYILYPTEKTGTGHVSSGKTLIFSFP